MGLQVVHREPTYKHTSTHFVVSIHSSNKLLSSPLSTVLWVCKWFLAKHPRSHVHAILSYHSSPRLRRDALPCALYYGFASGSSENNLQANFDAFCLINQLVDYVA